MKEKITKEEVIKKSNEEVNNELIEFGKANSKILKGEE